MSDISKFGRLRKFPLPLWEGAFRPPNARIGQSTNVRAVTPPDVRAAPALRNGFGPAPAPAAPLRRIYWPPRSGQRARALVVLCHGVASNGRALSELAVAWGDAARDAAFVAPDAPFRYRTRRAGWLNMLRLRKREWFSLIERSLAAEEAGVRTAAALLDRFIDAELAQLDLAPDAVVLAGFSQGAMMVLYTGLRRAVAPRGILGFSGAMPALPRLAAEARNRAPVLLVHGEADSVVPVSRSRDAERALLALGVPVELMTQPGVEHILDPAAMQAGAAFVRRVLG